MVCGAYVIDGLSPTLGVRTLWLLQVQVHHV
jgi:hypothetical protein